MILQHCNQVRVTGTVAIGVVEKLAACLLINNEVVAIMGGHAMKRDEPAYVVHTADCLAKVLGVSRKVIDEQTTRNARALFTV